MSEGELRLYKDLVNAERVSHIDFKLIAKKLFDELQQKENIIKEVRELINYYGITPDENDDVTVRNILKQFLEILDKGSDKE